ncbi:hypothetical protein QTH25_13255 [Clostridium perfringens]|uniref:hypothetical protein n=1 Tax=Clostridium perfringens TaxID=1502 RepID=UPI00338D77DD|nr:hypothetical protein [Clostridium perfringens]
MISKEELLKQKTRRDTNIENLEKFIDGKLKKVYPDCIENKEIKFEDVCLTDGFDDEIVQCVLKKYINEGGFSGFDYKLKQKGYLYIDITLKL